MESAKQPFNKSRVDLQAEGTWSNLEQLGRGNDHEYVKMFLSYGSISMGLVANRSKGSDLGGKV